jgi:putative transposase
MYSYHSTVMFERKRTSVELVMYALYLYFLGLSFRNTSKALEPFEEKRSHVSVWNWVQRFNPKKIYPRKRRVTAFIIDETMIQTGSSDAWLWVAIEPVHSTVLGVFLSRHRNMLAVESFLRSLVKVYGKHTVYSDGGTWYPEACSSLGLEHKLHTYLKKSLIERAIQYFKDRTENFDDYYPCTKLGLCNLSHVYKWLGLFVFMRNARIENIKFRTLRNIIGGETS